MMQAADHGRLDDSAFVKALRQGKACAGPVVVEEVLAQ
jgi:hypothetical protein